MTLLQQHRIIIYTTCYNVLDGVTLTIRKLEQEILAAGHSVCILTTLSGDRNNTHLDGQHPNRSVIFLDNAIPIPFLHDPNDPDLTYQLGFSLSRTLQRRLNDFEPTLIHITVPDCTALHLIEYARRKEIPIMGTYHSNIPEYMDHYPGLGWLKPILGGFFRHQYNFMQSLYVPTPYIRRHLVDTYQLDRATRLGIWGRGVDIERFHPDHRIAAGGKFRAQLGLAEDDVLLCWVGRLVPEKRVDIFCDTVRRMERMGLRFHAVVVGAGPCEEEVKALPNTTFCGWMNTDQLAVAYASSDVFLFPSSVETFGNVTLEAMASGLPVVVEGGCSGHLVEEGINGYACPVGDKNAFFAATADLVQDKEKRLFYSRNSRVKAEQLEKHSVVRRMLQYYQAVTDEFYTDYGGHHSNRDKEYSFFAGNHPRPMLLVLVEWLFIVLFQVLWSMSQLFLSVQDSIIRRRTNAAATVTATSLAQIPEVSKSTSTTTAPQTQIDTRAADSLTGSEKKTVEGCDVESIASSEQTVEDRPGSGSVCTKVDIPMAVSLSFIRSMEFSCRLESYLRNGLTSVRPRSLRLRKRKQSYEVFKRKTTIDIDSPNSSAGKDSVEGGTHRHNANSCNAVRSRSGGSFSASTLKEFIDVVYREPTLATSPGASETSSLVEVV